MLASTDWLLSRGMVYSHLSGVAHWSNWDPSFSFKASVASVSFCCRSCNNSNQIELCIICLYLHLIAIIGLAKQMPLIFGDLKSYTLITFLFGLNNINWGGCLASKSIFHKAFNWYLFDVETSWNQPVLSNEGNVFCSRKQQEHIASNFEFK